jgi:uncharacterized repeat protein (TIGR01451 family)
VTVTQTPGDTITKTADPTTAFGVGQQITYTFTVKNTGNVTLSGLAIHDTEAPPASPLISGPTCPTTTLAPGGSVICTAIDTVTLADLNNGSISDTATTTATPPDDVPITSMPSTATVAVTQTPAIGILKTADPTTVSKLGQVITYTYAVTNAGDVPLSNISVTDTQTPPAGPLASGPTCPASSIPTPGSTVFCTSTYTVSQADLDHGTITDTAVATAAANGQPVSSPPSLATVKVSQSAAITLTKTASPGTFSQVGQVITYTFVVTNSGNVTLSDPTVADTQTAPAGKLTNPPTCSTATLAPAASTTCTGQYAVTQADIDHGSIHDSAVATATPPDRITVTSNTDSATVTATRTPALTVGKTATPTTISFAGELIVIDFTVTNTGNVTLSGVTVTDNQIAASGTVGAPPACPGATAGAASTIAPGQTIVCLATYVTAAGDLSRGYIEDSAAASGTAPGSTTPTVSAPATLTVAVNPAALASTTATTTTSTSSLATTGAQTLTSVKAAAAMIMLGVLVTFGAARRKRQIKPRERKR